MGALIRKEIRNLVFAWQQYICWEVWETGDRKKFLNSLGIGLFVSLIITLLWVVKSTVYAQGELALDNSVGFPLYSAFSWVMSGGLLSAIIGFARARYRNFKRAADLFIAGIGLMISAPLWMVIAVLVKIDSDGPVFFRQTRLGKEGKLFTIYKFRSMRRDAEIDTGAVWAQDEDPRVTPLGRFLRKSHLDEIPQLWNVFKGDMSFIGPRPERPELQKEIVQKIPDFDKRLQIKPGITGLAQSRYQYGATMKDAQRKLKYDLIYSHRMCWALDFMIVWWTLGRVLTGEGAR